MVGAMLVVTPLSGPRLGMCGLGLGLGFKPSRCFIANPRFSGYNGKLRQWNLGRVRRPLVVACEAQQSNNSASSNNVCDRFRMWMLNNARRRQEPLGERIMRMVAGASSAPIAQYIPSPVTPLHTLDPRVKQVP